MGYRSLFRSVGTAIRQAEREERKRQRELERQQKYLAKMQALEQTEHEVQVYENRIALLGSIHKQCEDTIDWSKMKAMTPPAEPKYGNAKELIAQQNFNNFKPNILHKLFGLTEKKKIQLRQKIAEAKQADKDNYGNQCRWKKST